METEEIERELERLHDENGRVVAAILEFQPDGPTSPEDAARLEALQAEQGWVHDEYKRLREMVEPVWRARREAAGGGGAKVSR